MLLIRQMDVQKLQLHVSDKLFFCNIMIIMSYQASLNIAQSNAYFVSDSLQGDVVLYTNNSNQNFLIGTSNSNAYVKISKSNVIMTNNVTVGGNMQVPSIQFTVGGNIPTSQVVNIGNISGYNTASYGTSNVSTFSLSTSNIVDKFSFQAASNEVVAIYGDGTINQNGQDIANIFTFRNRIINGAMRIDQRTIGTSNSIAAGSSNQYTVDRWNILYNYTTGTVVYTQCNLSLSDSPYSQTGFRKSLRIQSGATFPGSGGTITTILPRQIIEGYTVDDFLLGTANASPMSLSFWFRSSFVGIHWFSLRNSGVNTQSYVGTFSINTSNAWQNIQAQIPATPSNFTWNSDSNACLELAFDGYQTSLSSAITNSWVSGNYIMPTGGSNMWPTNGFIEFTGVQLEKGNVCTPFEFRPYGYELSLCQRYYEIVASIGGVYSFGFYNAPGGGNNVWFQFKQNKRAIPVLATGGVSGGLGTVDGSNISVEQVAYHIGVSGAGNFYYNVSTPLAYSAEL